MTQLQAIQRMDEYIILHFTYKPPTVTFHYGDYVHVALDKHKHVSRIFLYRLEPTEMYDLTAICNEYKLDLSPLCSDFGFVNPPHPVQAAKFETT